ncbi:MAG TPA: glycogen synthase GlgA [Acetobacteraceae bacterium]|nr:glycogen synthase GlgA [Acetobacteraceae bacterium]
MRVLSVASELYPLVKTGGLADVAGALPLALHRLGMTVRSLIPGYPAVMHRLDDAQPVHVFDHLFGGPARLLAATAGTGLDLLVLDAPHLYDRPGNPYRQDAGGDWPDNPQRFAALSRAAADIGLGCLPSFVPDIVHAHDWQAGLAPAYLRYAGGPRPGTVMTVHNLAFQGGCPPWLLGELGLPPYAYAVDGVEYYGGIGFLKAGLWAADRITTVSPSYALEIQTDAGGMGLGGLLRSRAGVLSGILNGIDESVWNPATDPHLAATYGPDTAATARAANKAAVQQRYGLPVESDRMLFGVVSRLEWQKGLDLLLECLPGLLQTGAQLVMLGSGDPGLQSGFLAAHQAHPDRIGVTIGYDESLAHQIQAGSDAILVPSRFEPCGLTQLCALHYGAVPIVARSGGLADTVIDANEAALATGVATGLQFSPGSSEQLLAAIRRAMGLWQNRALWQQLQQNGMAAPVGWNGPARRYATLFQQLVEERRQ